jgi:cysteine-rich repeat protein
MTRQMLWRSSFLVVALVGCDSLIYRGDTDFCPGGRVCPPPLKCAARQDICIHDSCGNGTLDPGEVCDDGNIEDADGCSHNCKSNETCGNGVVDTAAAEVCDDGNTVSGDGCSADCRSLEGCGNGSVDPGEDCDSGPSGTPNVAKESPFCNSDCTWMKHGDGRVNKAAGEACDGDGNGHGNGHDCESAACNGDCTVSAHGDGKVNPSAGEQCDGDGMGHGNGKDCESKSCNHNCTPLRCGDGIVNPTAGEDCDRDGTIGHDGTSGPNGQSATCNLDCSKSACGDGKTNSMAGETCDEGAANSATGNCLPGICHLNVCGDGYVNHTLDQLGHPKEECDSGASNSDTSACLTSCKKATCGDGQVHVGAEDCDDGPASASAKTACPYGERTCSVCSACRTAQLTGPYCGDGKANGNEACDDGPRNGNTLCDYGQRTCQICNADCSKSMARTGPYCGDGHADPGEKCDDGPKNGTTSCEYGVKSCQICAADCSQRVARIGPYCGDGFTNGPESCDDGTKNGATSCVYGQKACQICSASCSQKVAWTGPYCGDGSKNGPEVCDDGNNVTETACPYGMPTCTGCRADCSAILPNLTGPFCGDGKQNGSEVCDDLRSFACGTCGEPGAANAVACTRLTTASPVGHMTVAVASPSLVGVTFTIDDGLNPPVTFEFVNGGPAHTSNVAIDISAHSTDAAAIAADVGTTVNAYFKPFNKTITATASQQTVTLTNDKAGLYGNQPITVTPNTSAALVVTGMAGGVGCPAGVACATDADCTSNATCSPHPSTSFGICK